MASKIAKKLATKGKVGMTVAKVLIVIEIIIKKIVKYIKKALWILIILAVFLAVFVGVGFYGKAGFIKGISDESDKAVVANSEAAGGTLTGQENEENTVANDETVVVADGMDSIQDEEVIIATADVDVATQTETEVTKEELEFNKSDWNLILVNKQHPIPDDYSFELGIISGSMECDVRILEPLNEMFEMAKEDGVQLVVCSPYREMSRQEYLFDRKMKGYLNNGYSYIDAYKESSAVVTVPGASEHQIGLSLDIISDNYYKLDESFELTDAGKWLKANAYKYGFILRYPKGKEEITGIIYEPWHYRYVGVDAAKIIHEKNITLEEFIEGL